jgi:urease accessory protein
MERIDGVLGNRTDATFAARIDEHERAGTLEVVRIEADNRKRSRLRVETDAGTDLGIVLEDPLEAGDVLALDGERAIVVEFERREAAVIDLPEPTERGIEVATELGHRVGNQHWDLAVRGGRAFVRAEADRHIVSDVLADSLPPGGEVVYEEVDPAIWIDDGDDEHSHGDGHHHDGEHSHADHGHTHDGSEGHVNYRNVGGDEDG